MYNIKTPPKILFLFKALKETLQCKSSKSPGAFIVYKIIYVTVHFVIIIVSYMALIGLLFVELGFR